MKYAIDLYLRTDNTTMLDNIKNEIPSKENVTVWSDNTKPHDGYDWHEGTEGIEDYIACHVRFYDKVDRDSIATAVDGHIDLDLINEYGLELATHDCYLDEDMPCVNQVLVRAK